MSRLNAIVKWRSHQLDKAVNKAIEDAAKPVEGEYISGAEFIERLEAKERGESRTYDWLAVQRAREEAVRWQYEALRAQQWGHSCYGGGSSSLNGFGAPGGLNQGHMGLQGIGHTWANGLNPYL